MPELPLAVLLIAVPVAFAAGFLDAVAGGGGTLTLPTLFLLGLSPAQAVATNKLQAIFGSATAALSYARAGLVSGWLPRLVPLALLGSVLGAVLVTVVPPESFRTVMGVAVLLAGAVVLGRKNLGAEDRPRAGWGLALAAGVLVIGTYDGFLGPGTGSFFMLLFALAGHSLLRASGNARALNFATNLGALGLFVFGGHILWWLGLPMGVANALGARLGARMAVQRGGGFIRGVYAVAVLLVAVTLLWPSRSF